MHPTASFGTICQDQSASRRLERPRRSRSPQWVVLAYAIEAQRIGSEHARIRKGSPRLWRADRFKRPGDRGGLLHLELRPSAAFPAQRDVARGEVGLDLGNSEWWRRGTGTA